MTCILLKTLVVITMLVAVSQSRAIMQNLNPFLDGFKECITTVMLFEESMELEPFSTPIILGNGKRKYTLSVTSTIFLRSKYPCIFYLLMYPPTALRTSPPGFVYSNFIFNFLNTYGIEHGKLDARDDRTRTKKELLEPYYLGIVSSQNYSFWSKDLLGYTGSAILGTSLYFQTDATDHEVILAGYVCRICYYTDGCWRDVLVELAFNSESMVRQVLSLEMSLTNSGHQVLWRTFLTVEEKVAPWSIPNAGTQHDIFVYIKSIIFETTASNLSVYSDENSFNPSFIGSECVPEGYHVINSFNFHPDRYAERNLALQKSIPLGTVGLNFLTCDSVDRIPFQFSSFLRPYLFEAWIFITISCLVNIIFVTLISGKFYTFRMIELTILYTGTLIEQSPSLTKLIENSERIMRAWPFTFGLWLLFSVILTNAYKGIVVTDLLAPAAWHPIWKRIQDIPEHYKVSMPIHPAGAQLFQNFMRYSKQPNGWEDRLFVLDDGVTFKGRPRNGQNTYIHEYADSNGEWRKSHFFRKHSADGAKVQLEGRPDIFFKELRSCDKNIFVTRSDDILIIRQYFNMLSGRDKFFEGIEPFWNKSTVMSIPDERKPYFKLVHYRAQGIMSAGIYDLFEKWSRIIRLANTARINASLLMEGECVSPCKVTIGRQIFCIFSFYFVGLLICIVVTVIECRAPIYNNYNMLQHWVISCILPSTSWISRKLHMRKAS